jgi:putative endonuclease
VGSNPTPSAVVSSAAQTTWFFYMVRCNDNSLYSGMTNNLEKRVKKHNDGTGARYTSSHRPVTLVHSERFYNSSEAKQRENEVKSWPKNKKEALISTGLIQQKGRS